MSIERRHVLYLDFVQQGGVLAAREELPDWEIHPANSLDKARRVLQQHHVCVGVVRLERGFEERASEAVGALTQVSSFVEWVGLVPAGALTESDGRLTSIIAEHFFDYHTLPLNAGRLVQTLGHAWGMSQALERTARAGRSPGTDEEMVGTSPVMQELFRGIRKVAAVDATVFIAGESGTGKELTARAIHERSRRAKGPFVAVDCTALPPTLIQSELFGYEKGSFTGAAQRKIGRIESASGGTLFLDEIGDLPLDLQGNLLRFLQESTIQRVGGREVIPVDVRVIAATHVDIKQAQQAGRFRQDLYFRLNVLRLRVPALRERGDDIELLARYFFQQFARESSKQLKGFSLQALRVLRSHEWPGNVRELINRVRRAIVMSESRLITPLDLGLEGVQEPELLEDTQTLPLSQVRAVAEREAVRQALRQCGNNVSEAARVLGVSRVTLYSLMQKYEIGADWRRNVESLRTHGKSGGGPVPLPDTASGGVAAASDRTVGE
jgi:DNA-binding NtrC family response regulator